MEFNWSLNIFCLCSSNKRGKLKHTFYKLDVETSTEWSHSTLVGIRFNLSRLFDVNIYWNVVIECVRLWTSHHSSMYSTIVIALALVFSHFVRFYSKFCLFLLSWFLLCSKHLNVSLDPIIINLCIKSKEEKPKHPNCNFLICYWCDDDHINL